MLKVWVTYPSREEERRILDRMAATGDPHSARVVLNTEDVLRLRRLVDQIYLDDKIKDYILDLVFATREPASYHLGLQQLIQHGASPRATLYLTLAAKAQALLQGRGYVTPQDVKAITLDVLRHRVMVTYEAEAEDITSDMVVQKILDGVPVP